MIHPEKYFFRRPCRLCACGQTSKGMADILRAPCPCEECQPVGRFLGASQLYRHVTRNNLTDVSIACPCIACKGVRQPFRTLIWHLRSRRVAPAGEEPVGVGWEAGLDVADDFFDGVLAENTESEDDEPVADAQEPPGPDRFPWDVDEDEPAEVRYAEALQLFSRQVCDAVGSNVLSQQGANTVMKIMDTTVSRFLPDYIRIGMPRSFEKLTQVAGIRKHSYNFICTVSGLVLRSFWVCSRTAL